uniref:Ribonuclease A-domain domain-containing protein n=1 Tax=Sander lucioperca TaxID=283035 RepID=A0A8D0CYQ4_SANLU
KTSADMFEKEHLVANLCTQVMIDRGLNDDGSCKWSNTFIKAPLKAVTNVCKTPALKGNLHRSTTPFDLIYCKQTMENAAKKAKPPHCEYEKGEFKAHKIIEIGCDKKGNPIHFHKFL